jgi:hypothetical protein
MTVAEKIRRLDKATFEANAPPLSKRRSPKSGAVTTIQTMAVRVEVADLEAAVITVPMVPMVEMMTARTKSSLIQPSYL